MNKKTKEVNELNGCFTVLHSYLGLKGWILVDPMGITNDMFQLKDPITGRSHDVDYAFTLQCERNRAELKV